MMIILFVLTVVTDLNPKNFAVEIDGLDGYHPWHGYKALRLMPFLLRGRLLSLARS
jgi:hypothetical protein